MTGVDLECGDRRRRVAVRRAGLNGLDAVEVSPDHLTLTVTFLGRAPEDVTRSNVRIDGGVRVKGIKATGIRLCGEDDPELDDRMLVTVDKRGDFSTYTLRLVEAEHGRPGEESFHDFDPRSASIPFSFTADCPTELDCAEADNCPPPVPAEPEISYLAKDYASFRRLILDRLALIMPGWTERHVPDLGITLVELLAYIGDHLSYYQDAVATEAYLDTARRRISVRRHVRLVDYPMHDGCNARAWVCVEVSAALPLQAGDASFVTAWPRAPVAPGLRASQLRAVPAGAYETFEPLAGAAIELLPAHNSIRLWTWGDRECCLPAGATAATLRDEWVEPEPGPYRPEPEPKTEPDRPQPYRPAPAYRGEPTTRASQSEPPYPAYQGKPGDQERQRALRLRPGDVLLFEELVGPGTGARADADPTHRQAVRLTRVQPLVDTVCDQPVVEVEWAAEDALSFPLCVSAVAGPHCDLVDPISVARGNVVLVDHGRSLTWCGGPPEGLDAPPAVEREAGCEGVGEPRDPVPVRRTVVLTLAGRPVTQRAPFPVPGRVAGEQASELVRIPALVRARLRQLWRKTRAGQRLEDAEVDEVRTIFGDRALAEADLPVPPRRGRRAAPTAEVQATALGRLLAAERKLLAKKLRWLESLARRARAGLVLGDDQIAEIREAWGERYAVTLDRTDPRLAGPASEALNQDPRQALPTVVLQPGPWVPRRDLLASDGDDRHFVGELDDEGRLHLRFGDGEAGRAPRPGSTFQAGYRVGDPLAGNVGRDAIAKLVLCAGDPGAVTRVRNPLQAVGGTGPEPLSEVRAFAPAAFRRDLRRAITAEDYAALAGRVPGVQRAAASLRWTGAWYEAEVAVDPLGRQEADEALLQRVREYLYRFRRIGHDLVVEQAVQVPILVKLRVCVLPDHLVAHVRATLLDALGSRVLPDGRRGYFHPDNLTFGDDVRASRLVAVAQAVPGVESAEVIILARLEDHPNGGPAAELAEQDRAKGVLSIGPLEIARLNNDPDFPEHGRLELDLRGGR